MSYSEDNTYEKILDRALSNTLLDGLDKRTGSIVYNALAPVCLEMAEIYAKMDILEEQSHLLTATGSNLDKVVYDYGITREESTYALRIARFQAYETDSDDNILYYDEEGNLTTKGNGGQPKLIDMDITVGSRFSVPDENNECTYEYIGLIEGYKILQCEQDGVQGNVWSGTVLPITQIKGLAKASIISTYTPAQDEEDDDELRKRALGIVNNMSFGGNIPDYIQTCNAQDGVGNTKVFPAWVHNGSVLLSIVDSTYTPASTEFIAKIKKIFDPEESTGEGVGLAPIGHYVTVTTPSEVTINVKISIELEADTENAEVYEEIQGYIEDYFTATRKKFAQDVNLAIYRSRVMEYVLKCESVLNVTSVLLNDTDADVVFTDEAKLNGQYLPKLGEFEIV